MKLFARSSKDGHFSHEMISSYLDGALRAKEMEGIDLHLASCDACRQQADDLRAVVEVLRAMPTVPAPRSFAIPAPATPGWSPEPSRPWWSPAPLMGLRAAAVAAAVALAVVFAGDLSGSFGSSPDVPIQVGKTEPAPLITAGSPPGPEISLPLGEDLAVDSGTSAAVDLTDVPPGAVDAQPSLIQDKGFALGLWPLELGLLALTLTLGGFTFFLKRRFSTL